MGSGPRPASEIPLYGSSLHPCYFLVHVYVFLNQHKLEINHPVVCNYSCVVVVVVDSYLFTPPAPPIPVPQVLFRGILLCAVFHVNVFPPSVPPPALFHLLAILPGLQL